MCPVFSCPGKFGHSVSVWHLVDPTVFYGKYSGLRHMPLLLTGATCLRMPRAQGQ